MKIAIALSFLIIQTACAFNDDPPVFHILRGSDAKLGEFPFMAGLKRFNQDVYCGGALVSDRHVVTAAACTIGYGADVITVLLGTNDLLADNGEYFEVEKITTSDDFSETNDGVGVAILTLSKKVAFSDTVSKISLAKSDAADEAYTTLSGFGYKVKDINNGYMSQILQKLQVQIVNQNVCAKKVEQFVKVQPQHLCGFTATGAGACYGDSGSPLVIDNTLVGIALSVHPDCAEGNPDIYARITYYSDFIEKTISQ